MNGDGDEYNASGAARTPEERVREALDAATEAREKTLGRIRTVGIWLGCIAFVVGIAAALADLAVRLFFLWWQLGFPMPW